MLIDRGYEVNTKDYLYEYCLKENLSGKHILDFGFNNGNLLRSIPDDVNFTYTGIEVQEDFVTSMSAKYPEHNFIHFNKYHHSYNIDGDRNLELADIVSDTYDIIFAWNVFTHCTYEYTKKCIEEMKVILNTDGKIVFNLYSKNQLVALSNHFTTMHNLKNLKNGEHVAISSIGSFDNYAYWKNAEELIYDTVIDENLDSLFSCYDMDWLVSDSGWTQSYNHKDRIYTFTVER